MLKRTLTRATAALVAAGVLVTGLTLPEVAVADEGSPWRVAEAEQRLPLHLQAPGISSTLEDFPVLVTLDSQIVDVTALDPDALVFHADGVEHALPYEVEHWDPAGTSSIWVKVPALDSGVRSIDMYFGGEVIENTTNPQEVWSENFEVVAHMNDASGNVTDSTANGFTAEPVGELAYGQVTESGTPAILFDDQDDHLLYQGSGNIPSEHITEAITVGATVYLTDTHFNTAENHIFSRYQQLEPADRPWGLFVHNGVSNVRATINGVWTQQGSPSVAHLSEGWHDVVFKYDGSHLSMFYNGDRLLHAPFSGPIAQSSSAVLRLGASAGLRYDPDTRAGMMFDEFRIADVARSDDWIRAEHLTRTGQVVSPQAVESQDGTVALALDIAVPGEGATVGATFEITGTTNQLAEVSYALNDDETQSIGEHEGAFTIPVTGLEEGAHELTVTVTRDGLNPVSRTVNFFVDATAPDITVNSPVSGGDYDETGFLIDVEVSEGTVALQLDGQPVRNNRRIVPALSGEHTLVITATDAYGNVSTEEVVFTAAGTSDEREPWLVAQAQDRLPFTIAADGITETLEHFPVLVQFGSDDIDVTKADADHLVFTAAGSADPLPYEVEVWNPEGVTSVWVKAPTVSAEASQIFMYYNGAPENTTNPEDVWDDGFLAVTHMNTAGGSVPDSTGNGNELTVVRGAPDFGVNTGSQTPGIRLNGEALEYESGVTNGIEQITMSTSIYLAPAHVASDSLENYIAAREISGFTLDDQLTWLLHQGSIGPRLTIGGQWQFTDRNPVQAGWNTMSWTFDGERLIQVINGQKVSDWEKPGAMRPDSALALRLGEMPSGAWRAKPGYIYDEFRVSSIARSVDWQRAEYLAATGQLVTAGAREASSETDDLSLTLVSPSADQAAPIEPVLRGSVSRTAAVEYVLDGAAPVAIGARLGGFSAQLPELAAGEHTLLVRADAGGETVSQSVTFTVDATKPEIEFVSPVDGANYGTDGIEINVLATDESGIDSLRLVLDGKPVENGATFAPEELVGDDHVLTAVATDGAGNVREASVSFIAVGTAAPDAWLVPEARKRIPFLVDAPNVATIQDFPVLIQFDNRMLDYSTIDPNHIVFTAGDDPTPLPYDVERWFSSAQLTSIWVKVPVLNPGQPETVTMYFDGAPRNETDPADVWDEHHEFVAHFGLSEPPIPDVTGTGAAVDQYEQQGYWAGAGNQTPAVQIDNTPALFIDGEIDASVTARNFMMSMTANISSVLLEPGSGRHVLWARGEPNGMADDDQFAVYIEEGDLYFAHRFGSPIGNWRTLAAPIEEGWRTIHVSYDGSPMKVYVDGEEVGRLQVGQPIYAESQAPLTIGSLEDGSHEATTLVVDEFRISSATRNADWALLEYLSASRQLVQAGGMQTSDSAPVLFLGLPAPSGVYGPGVLAVSGSTWEPLEVSYSIDGSEPKHLGVIHGDYGDTVEGLAHGDHEIVVTGKRASGRETVITATFSIDRSGPAVTFNSPTEGSEHLDAFLLDVDANDPSGVSSLVLTIDGREFPNGELVSLEDLVGLRHELVATATDSVGNVSTTAINFDAPGAYPAVPVDPEPADGATKVDPGDVTLSVLVDDAASEPLDVTFHWTYVGSADGAFEGSTLDGEPAVGAGTEIDPVATTETDGEVLATTADQAYPFQRFEVDVPDDLGAAQYQVGWTGQVPAGHRAELSVWNYTTEAWEELAEGQGGAEITLSAVADTADTVRNGTAQIIVQNVPAMVMDTDTQARFFWMTDTQMYAHNSSPIYKQMTEWVVEHWEEDDIVYGIHTGDIVNYADREYQWHIADEAHKVWDDAGFPYGVLPGNHDVTSWDRTGHDEYRKWFGAHRFEDNPWYGGTVSDNIDHYDIISTPGADYLFMYLGMAITPATVSWANSVIQAHPDHNVIIGVHIYLLPYDGHDYEYQGRMVYDEIVAPNANVGMVLTGHNCAPVTRVQHPTPERTVYEVMMDPQCNPHGGDGYARYIDMDTETSLMTHSTFSTRHDGTSYWPEGQPQSAGSLDLVANENRTDPYDLILQSRSISTDSLTVSALASDPIQSETVTVEAGERASITLDELGEHHEYFWYATSTNSRGYSTNSPVFSFTTGVLGGEEEEPGEEEPGEEEPGEEEPGEEEPGEEEPGEGEPGEEEPGDGTEEPGDGDDDPRPVTEELLTEDARGGVTATPNTLRAGSGFVLTATGDHADTWAHVWIHSTPRLVMTAQLDAEGSVLVTAPQDLAPGTHRVVLQATDGSLIGWTEITIEATAPGVDAGTPGVDGGLSVTGSEGLVRLAVLAALLVLAGAVTVVATRSRVRR